MPSLQHSDVRAKHSLILGDHGTNFTGATRELKEIYDVFNTQQAISEFCSAQPIKWRFIPECAPRFGGLWEAAIKSQ